MLSYCVAVWQNITAGSIWKTVASIVTTVFTFLFGVDNLLTLAGLVTLIAIDFFLGIGVAWARGVEITPKTAFKTPVKMLVYGAMIASSHLTDVATFNLGVFEQGMIIFLAITEFISVLRNCGLLGFATPRKLLNIAHDIQHRYD